MDGWADACVLMCVCMCVYCALVPDQFRWDMVLKYFDSDDNTVITRDE